LLIYTNQREQFAATKKIFQRVAKFRADWRKNTGLSSYTLSTVADIPTGKIGDIYIVNGQAVLIMTGAPVPRGADTVVMIQDTDVEQRSAGITVLTKANIYSRTVISQP